ncbi:FAD-binding protein [Neolewinella lacunae]|uniref:FAD-binding protein n=1 Tax=Neolewinella lacunae TaxID=1517758 RepID=A0A923PQP7_9BACT|nr:FAD-binding protein [Neolewinella lacunae]MBC6996785.1 FAD-binding protein [Neolewinella lacunae]MDN3637013.1 FAD-binding protein [Neolewinella lacunae]
MNERLAKISVDRYTWINASRNVEVTPRRFFFPADVEDLRLIVREAESRGLRVRAVGSGHSYSEAPKGQDFLLSMKKMRGLQKTDPATLRSAWRDRHLVSAGAGTILKRLTRRLDAMGLALTNMGAVDFQTISGAMLTGTHGTGIAKPAVPDMVRSVRMVATGGELLQIEPLQGMTDPVLHAAAHPDLRLIQDDAVFHNVILGFGATGIIYELTLEVEPQFWMQERRTLVDWQDLRAALLDGSFMEKVRGTDFVAFRVNPYAVKGKHRCAIVEQTIVDRSQQPRGLHARMRNIFATVLGNIEYLVENTIRKLQLKPEGVKKTIQLALWSTKDMSYFGKSHRVLYQSGNAVIRYGISAEFAFPAHAEKIVEVIEAIFVQAERNAAEAGLYQSAHIPVRFVAPSQALLSSAYGRETAYIDVPLLFGTVGDIEILEGYQEMMIRLGGIPHWGKHNTRLYQHHDFIRAQFARLDDWIEVRDRLDPRGTFLNDFVRQMGLTRLPEIIPGP